MNRTITSAALLAAALATAPAASAATAYMDGLFNVGPKWDTITAPGGQVCPKTSCKEVRYDYITPKSAATAAGKWMDANNTEDAVLFTFSLGTVGAYDARVLRPDWKGTIVMLGSPTIDPGNDASSGGRPALVLTGGGKVDIVTADGDSVSQTGGTFSTHLNGYTGRNFATETPIRSTSSGGVTNSVYTPRAPKPSTSVPPRPRFNLFDIRTWFVPRTTAPTTTARKAAPDANDDLGLGRADRHEDDLGESGADSVDRDADLELDRDSAVRVSRSAVAEGDDAAGDHEAVVREPMDRRTRASRDAEPTAERASSVTREDNDDDTGASKRRSGDDDTASKADSDE